MTSHPTARIIRFTWWNLPSVTLKLARVRLWSARSDTINFAGRHGFFSPVRVKLPDAKRSTRVARDGRVDDELVDFFHALLRRRQSMGASRRRPSGEAAPSCPCPGARSSPRRAAARAIAPGGGRTRTAPRWRRARRRDRGGLCISASRPSGASAGSPSMRTSRGVTFALRPSDGLTVEEDASVARPPSLRFRARAVPEPAEEAV